MQGSNVKPEQQVEKFREAFNSHDPDKILAEVDERFRYHDNFLHDPITDKSTYRQYLQEMLGCFPDLTLTLDKVVVGRNEVAAVALVSGTQKGEFKVPEGKVVPPSNKPMKDVQAVYLRYGPNGK